MTTTHFKIRLEYEDLSTAYVGSTGRVVDPNDAEIFSDRKKAQQEADCWRTMDCDAFPVPWNAA